MTTCKPCNGTGIVGTGPEPWLHIGQKSTCTECTGTGVVDETSEKIVTAADNVEETSTTGAVELANTASSPKVDSSAGSSDSSGGDQQNQN